MTVFQKTKIEFVDLGLSVKWATCNIGASAPEDCGMCVTRSECENLELDTEVRVPSRKEFLELMQECTWRFTIQNGVKGDLVVGHNGNSIFLPFAGYCTGAELHVVGLCGYYWGSVVSASSYAARSAMLENDSCRLNNDNRCYGLTVRPVCE